MAYQSWSVTFGEQPSAAKWNILGTNDSSFNDSTGINLQYNNLAGFSNPYKFSVYRNSAANTGNGTVAKVSFDTELFDTNNNFASGTYTAPVAGFYQFNTRVSVSGSHTRLFIALYKNGSELIRIADHGTSSVTNDSVQGGLVVQSAANDTWEIYAFGNTTTAIVVGSSPIETWFTGFLVSKT